MSGAKEMPHDDGDIVFELRALHEMLRQDMRGYHATNPDSYGMRPPPSVLAFVTESSVKFHKRVADVAYQLVCLAAVARDLDYWARTSGGRDIDSELIYRLRNAYANLLDAGRNTQ